eukprot:472767-Amphidinium_carterae.1
MSAPLDSDIRAVALEPITPKLQSKARTKHARTNMEEAESANHSNVCSNDGLSQCGALAYNHERPSQNETPA